MVTTQHALHKRSLPANLEQLWRCSVVKSLVNLWLLIHQSYLPTINGKLWRYNIISLVKLSILSFSFFILETTECSALLTSVLQ